VRPGVPLLLRLGVDRSFCLPSIPGLRVHPLPAYDSGLQGSHRCLKTWKVLEFVAEKFQALKSWKLPTRSLKVLEYFYKVLEF